MTRQLVANKRRSLKQLVDSTVAKVNKVPDFLGGVLKTQLLGLLETREKAGGHIYASLFELSDPEVTAAFQTFGQTAHIILPDGTHKASAPKQEKAKSGGASKSAEGLEVSFLLRI